jgi:hypothetical protein
VDDLKIGKKVEIQTAMGHFTIRIMHIEKVAPPKNAAPGCDSWFRLGVKKVSRFFS